MISILKNVELKTTVITLLLMLSICITGFSQALGDVNNTGQIDIVDALLIAQYYVGLNPGGFNAGVADTNCDNSIDIVDALLIAQYYVGLITELPCQPAPTPIPTTVPGGPPISGSWEPIPELTDEFSGTSLDTNKWQYNHPYWSGREPSQYNAANVSVGGGNLQLKSTVANYNQTGNWVWAACITSLQKTVQAGGYYESRIKGSNISMTSAFWMQGSYSEIDVIENIGESTVDSSRNRLMRINTHYYPNGWDNDIKTPHNFDMGFESDSGFHVYAVYWENNSTMRFYLDNIEVWSTQTGGPFNEPMYMFFDTEVFTWDGLPTISSLDDNNKNTMYVDWVRSWRRK